MSFDRDAYHDHLQRVAATWNDALAKSGYDVAIVPAGVNSMYFEDDQAPPFRPNPHFAQWLPERNCEHSVLVIRSGQLPRLLFHQPADYWHQPPEVPDWASDEFELDVHRDSESLTRDVAAAIAGTNRSVLVGPDQLQHNIGVDATNPAPLMHRLRFARAQKTPFEIDNMRVASTIAVRGHIAARDAFFAGASEFEIHMAYLAASAQTERDLPYGSIVALNEHAGVLHYQHYDRTLPAQRASFLIDAGGSHLGYAADVTRTYSAHRGDIFEQLIEALDARQQALISDIRPGVVYVDLHERMHRDVAALLHEFELVKCSADTAFETGITDAFFPHGLGHLLGLQTHDVGGQLADSTGGSAPPPARYPALRLTRTIEEGQVFTIEPGLYFIPLLLNELRDNRDVAWANVDSLLGTGGIRIEDNVVVTSSGVENLTRNAFAAA